MFETSFEKLLAYAAGELSAEEAAKLKRLLETSPQASETARLLRCAVSTMRTDDSEAPPADVIAAARNIYVKPKAATPRSWLEGLREVVASLVYDSRLQPALAGYRSAQDTVQVSYAAGDLVVDLQMEPPASAEETSRRIVGQISLPDPTAQVEVRMCVSSGDAPAIECATDEFGMFSMSATAGCYELMIRTPEFAVVIPELQVA